jgi:hypothetical protein
MATPESGLGLQTILYPAISGTFPVSFAETPTGTLLLANGIDRMVKWDPLAAEADTAGVARPTAAMELGAINVGKLTGQYVAYCRFIDKDGNPSDLSPVSNDIDAGRDGWIEAVEIRAADVLVRSQAHGLASGDPIIIEGVQGPSVALLNNTWTVTVVDADSFAVPLVLTSGTYQQGGLWTFGVATIVYGAVPVPVDEKVVRKQILRNLDGNADVLYVDIDTDQVGETAFLSTREDDDLATQEAVPLTYGDDDLPYANRYGVPPSHKAVVAIHQGRAFATADVTYAEGHAEAAFNAATVRGVGTAWKATFAGRLIYVDKATKAYEIAAVDEDAQVLTLTAPYLEPPVKFARYAIRPAPAERRLVYYSEPGTIEAWPAYNALALPEDSDEIVGLFVKGQFLYAIERRHLYRITFQEDPLGDGFVFLTCERGCVNNRCYVTVEGVTYMLDEAGIHAFDGQDTENVSDPIQNLFQVDGIEELQVDWTADQRAWHAAHDPVRNTIRWFLAMVGERPLVHAICYNYRQKRYWIEQYPTPITASCVATLGYRRSLVGTEARRVLCLAEGALDGVEDAGTLRGTLTGATATSLTDSAADFAALEGASVAIVDGTGRGQVAVVASNTRTEIVLRGALPIVPDATSVYQVGGIPWTWRSGWFHFATDEGDNPRDVELVYQPLATPTTVDLRIYYDHEATPRVWDYTTDDDDKILVSGSPFIAFKLDTAKGYVIQRITGHSDPYAFGDAYVSVELSGIQAGEPVRIHEVVVSGAGDNAS